MLTPREHDCWVDFGDRDMQTLMETLFDIKVDIEWILRLLLGEESDEAEEDHS